mmetsp:Transcript_61185/g.161887  ORF Transcript_61185/g.161887 Transcript_61185/m.161887 type:complete len:263 (-) Transcript_61185:25-813(-)
MRNWSTVRPCAAAADRSYWSRPSSSVWPGMRLITRTFSVHSGNTGRGTTTSTLAAASDLAIRSMSRASRARSASIRQTSAHAFTASYAAGLKRFVMPTRSRRSVANVSTTSGNRTLIATARPPSSNTARCTCPTDAAPSGSLSIDAKCCSGLPSSWPSTLRMSSYFRGLTALSTGSSVSWNEPRSWLVESASCAPFMYTPLYLSTPLSAFRAYLASSASAAAEYSWSLIDVFFFSCFPYATIIGTITLSVPSRRLVFHRVSC